jgi:hypothetical protein
LREMLSRRKKKGGAGEGAANPKKIKRINLIY